MLGYARTFFGTDNLPKIQFEILRLEKYYLQTKKCRIIAKAQNKHIRYFMKKLNGMTLKFFISIYCTKNLYLH